ncbi:hypothetical protein MKW92_007623 [Papaver armeniacum]|nr:hypothetical protein MKW92_007623 [Papaver armeniacum]
MVPGSSSNTNAAASQDEAGLESSIRGYTKGMEEYDSGKAWTIFRIPRNMFEISKNSYLPKLVSIGPFHHGVGDYTAMEEHKKRYLLRLLGYGTHPETSSPRKLLSQHSEKLELLENEMMKIEKETRECYSEPVDMDKKMMVMDGCFVIELLRLHDKYLINNKDVDDPIFTTRWMLCTLRRDLLMLENQLPYKVLQKLFDLTAGSSEQANAPLTDLIIRFFNPLLQRSFQAEKSLHLHEDEEFKHMLGVFRTSFHPDCNRPEQAQTENNSQLNHSATELQEAGVRFRINSVPQREPINKHIDPSFNIHFEQSTGILNIPPLQIDNNTVPLFLNFIAYEQCDRKAEPYFTNLFMFLDRLVNTAQDIEILHNREVINHALGSDQDVANLINKLSREIIYDADTCHLRKHMNALNVYYNTYDSTNKLYVWFKTLKRDYFNSPWTVASLIGAVLLLILTVCQTILAFYAYFKPPSAPSPK